jgi:hypothetical protein
MNWLRTIRQKLSYKLGFARGLRSRPFAISWWADMTTYSIGHIHVRLKSLGPSEMHRRFPAAGDFGAPNQGQIPGKANAASGVATASDDCPQRSGQPID